MPAMNDHNKALELLPDGWFTILDVPESLLDGGLRDLIDGGLLECGLDERTVTVHYRKTLNDKQGR